MNTDLQLELEHLLARTVLGDRAAFQGLYDKSSARIFGVLLKMLGNEAQAQDVLQDTYIKIWSRAGEYHAERGSVMTWLTTIARYRALDIIRAEKRRQTAGQLMVPTEAYTMALESDDSQMLNQCLEQLATLQRQTILDAFVSGCTHEELAAQSNTPIGTIKSRIRRGLQRLKECLER